MENKHKDAKIRISYRNGETIMMFEWDRLGDGGIVINAFSGSNQTAFITVPHPSVDGRFRNTHKALLLTMKAIADDQSEMMSDAIILLEN